MLQLILGVGTVELVMSGWHFNENEVCRGLGTFRYVYHYSFSWGRGHPVH